jgi:hypothetical protein
VLSGNEKAPGTAVQMGDGNGGRRMISNPFYTPEIHGPCELYDLRDFVPEEGYTSRVIERISGHLVLFCFEPHCPTHVDPHLGELLETSV